jgi:hypothetical protein
MCRPAAAPLRRAPEICTAGAEDNVAPTREAFFREVLFPAPTARTPRFDDYTPDSYHVEKLDLAQGLPAEARRCGVALRALLVVGPVGPLWAYHVIAFVSDGDSLRVSSLVMPHARITGKGTGRVADGTLTALLRDLQRSPLVRVGLPTWADTVAAGPGREYTYQVLLTVYREDTLEHWHAPMLERRPQADAAAVDRLFAQLNTVLETTKPTYPDSATRAKRSAPD